MKPKHQNQRLLFVGVGLGLLGLALGLVFSGLQENISYFYAPAELHDAPPEPGEKIRLGGMVEKGSFKQLDGINTRFVVTDFKKSVPVVFDQILPDLFREGQGIIAEGVLGQDGVFVARRVLAKHDENYMPPEVADALKD